MRHLLVVVVPFLLGVLPANADEVAPTVEELENAVLDARRRLVAGELEIRTVTERQRRGDQADVRQMHLWFQNDQRRCDSFRRGEHDTWERRSLHCENCGEDDFHISIEFDDGWGVDHFTPLSLTEMNETRSRQRGIDSAVRQMPVVDPRMLGLVPTSVGRLATHAITSIVGAPQRGVAEIRSGTWGDHSAWTVSYVRENSAGSRVEYTVIPEFDFGVVSITADTDLPASSGRGGNAPHDHVQSNLEVEFQSVSASDAHWFPKTLHYVEIWDGEVAMEQTADVSVVSLNDPIPEQVFRIEGMDLPVPTPIIRESGSRREHFVWNGSIVEPRSTSEFTPQARRSTALPFDDEGAGSSWTFWLLIVNGFVLFAVAIALLVRRRMSGDG